MGALTVAEFYEQTKDSLQLEVLGHPDGFHRMITMADASGPGLVLAGYTGRFVHQRIQVLGETEVSYLASLSPEERHRNLATYFTFEIPLVMVSMVRAGEVGGFLDATLVQVAESLEADVKLRSRIKSALTYRSEEHTSELQSH